MRNVDIMAITNAYTTQKEKGTSLKLPAAIAWKRRVNMDKLFNARKIIEEAIGEVQKKYSDDEHSTGTEDGARKVKQEYIADFMNEQTEILNQDTEVDISKVKVDALGDIQLTDEDMDTLAFMLE